MDKQIKVMAAMLFIVPQRTKDFAALEVEDRMFLVAVEASIMRSTTTEKTTEKPGVV